MKDLIQELIKEGWLKTERIIQAFKKIKRKDFLREEDKRLAGFNEAVSIGYGQTISQPLVVAFMLELLSPREGDKILDIGSGSGWTTALLCELVGKKGKVIALEIVPELVRFGKKNVSKYNFIEKGIASFFCLDGREGFEKETPFDKILCSASTEEIPLAWKEQIKDKGKVVCPVKSSIWYLEKKGESFFQKEFPGFFFVPLVKKHD